MADRAKSRKKGYEKSLGKSLFYRFIRMSSRIVSVFLFDFRAFGREHTLVEGPALILSTHQSHFDPVLVGATFNEQLNYLARRTLFKNRLFGALITLLDAIELDRDRSGLGGLKETIRRVRSGKKVLIFPEGTRTTDGRIAPLKPGFLAVARRCKVPLIPIAITGAYNALPKGAKLPIRYPMRIAVGEAIDVEEFQDLDDDAMLALVKSRLDACYNIAQSSREIS
ncbi:MAG TPA: 1-acyl-sn-glycerol-3-phosphate acyltransferase [Planctomycetaceae bacterium]|nr:1-acyl-sn-glycerol-3-phosphate acyltransferase [Planctomycetaceae bacterium]